MATLQQKSSRGHKYWSIVESRRVNGKPRPVVLAYIGTAENLLRRLEREHGAMKVKSYSHGAVAALLNIASKLDIPETINKYVESSRKFMAKKPLRNGLTVGATILLGAIGRVCMPTSKRGWWDWAKTTSCEHLLRCSFSGIDSQHFWDLMDALPVEAIKKIECELLERVRQYYPMESNTLFFDTTNFFTYIATTNARCAIAKRGKNKQKRNDLRQVGLAMVVTRKDFIPLFHLTYEGNRNDSKIFREVISVIKSRMLALGMDMENHTIVFDRGNNSKKNLALVSGLKIHYIGALTPYHHRTLLDKAEGHFQPELIHEQLLQVYRAKETIWDEERTVLVFVSDRLKAGQLRGVYQALEKREKELQKIQQALSASPANEQDRATLEDKIKKLVKGQFLEDIIVWSLTKSPKGRLQLAFSRNEKKLTALGDELGVRILMTDRHDWDTPDIIKSYYGQSFIEQAFKNLKNPYHLALRPQFHWTDQKIIVHFFICVLGYLLSTLLWRDARSAAHYGGTLDSLLDSLNNIRLATFIEPSPKRGKPRATHQLEEMSDEEAKLLNSLGIAQLHIQRIKLGGVGVYGTDRL